MENNKAESKIRTVNFYLENRKWLEKSSSLEMITLKRSQLTIKTAKEILNQN